MRHVTPGLAAGTVHAKLDRMCDACLQLGSPWLHALHEGRPRPRTKLQLRLARHQAKPAAKAATRHGRRRDRSS
jgi:hypothetical protein